MFDKYRGDMSARRWLWTVVKVTVFIAYYNVRYLIAELFSWLAYKAAP